MGVPGQRRELAGHRLDLLGAVAAGGILGAEARYAVSVLMPHPTGGWPGATLVINVSGCFLIGVLMAVLGERTAPHRLLRPFIGVGILGGYTTFSTYSVDLVQMLAAGRPGPALVYLVVTPIGAVVAVWAGSVLTRRGAAVARRRSRPTGGRP
jgi:CrcB protein